MAWDWTGGFNEANALYRDRKFGEAAALYQRVTHSNAPFAKAWLGWARCLVAQGRHAQAIDHFRQCLQHDATDYSAWLELAHSLRMEGQIGPSIESYRQAMALEPARFEAPLGLVRTLEIAGRREESDTLVAGVVAQLQATNEPHKLRTFCQRLGRYRLELGELPSAFALLRQARELCAHITNAAEREEVTNTIRLDLAEILLRDKQPEPAHRLLTGISQSTDEKTLTSLAELAYRFNLHHEAVAVLEKNRQQRPASIEAHLALASMQAECWLLAEAEHTLRAAEALGDVPQATELRARIASKLGDAETAFRVREAWLQAQPADKAKAHHESALAMSALYCDFLGAQDIVALHRNSFSHLGEGARPVASFDLARLAQAGVSRKIRLGLVSADFHHQHPVNIFMQPVLRELDRSRFEVTLYYNGAAYDEETVKARSRVDHWVEATYLTDRQLAGRIEAAGIDLLLDLSGHTDKNRMRLFGQRAAPIQVTYLGYPGSSGVPHIDWLLGDATVTPPEHQALYSERIATLDGNVFCYAPEANYPYPQYSAAHASRPLTFGSFNNLTKVNQKTLSLWLQIHRALPESRLLLKTPSFAMATAQAVYRDRLRVLGFDLDRVELQGPVGLTDMMAQYEQLDIALDPVPYNGGTTTLQAMWMGVPVVCRQGDYFTSRMSASFMGRAGLGDWVAQTDADYVRIAVEKARDRAALLALKQGLRARQQALPAWDAVQHTRAFERCLVHILQRATGQWKP